MYTNVIAAQSYDIFIAATNVANKKFKHAVASSSLLAAEFERMYEVLINDIDDETTRAQVLNCTEGTWRNAVFTLELLELTQSYARVVLGGVVYDGYIFDITARDWLRLEAKSYARQKVA